jgi:low affinity Fe/Cu permease
MAASPPGPDRFRRFAHRVAFTVGTSRMFAFACATIVLWAALGPVFHFSDTWQLVINTGTTIVTFLMVFLIQNTQNREAITMNLKIDELIKAVRGARNNMLALDERTDDELKELEAEFRRLGDRARDEYQSRKERRSEKHHPTRH